jgi:hypothetical protein
MPKKRKPKPFRAVKAVKATARERIGRVPPAQVVPDRKKKKDERHKPTLGELLGEE